MARLPDAVVGNAHTNSQSWDVLTDLVDVGSRMAGQDGEATGAQIVADAFESAGLDDVSIDEFPIAGWWRGDSSMTIDTPRERTYTAEHEILALPGTPDGTARGRLIDVGPGRPEDFEDRDLEGAVVMASSRTPDEYDRWLHRMEKYVCAAEAGADAFLFRNHVEGCLPPTGEVGYHERPGPIPAVGVSKELGARLERTCNTDTPEVTLTVDCRSAETSSRNVVGSIGPDTEETVLVTAHVDAHDIAEGATDNGAGSALVTEVGRLLAQVPKKLDTNVRLITFGAEEIGLWGAYHWADTHDLSAVKAVLNIDGAGGSGTLGINANGFDDLRDAVETAGENLEAPIQGGSTISPHGDQWAFVQEGVPAAMCYAASETSGRGYGHTHADTLEKLDSRELRSLAVLIAEAVCEVAATDRTIERKDRETIREEIDTGYERELKRGGRWPYEN